MNAITVVMKFLTVSTFLFLLSFSNAFAERDHDHKDHGHEYKEKHHKNHPHRYEYYDNGRQHYGYYCEQRGRNKMRCYDERRRHPYFVYVPVTRVVQVAPVTQYVEAAPVTRYVESAPVTRVVESPRYANQGCANCGVVIAVNTVNVPAGSSGVGAVAGAVVGGLLGNQVGGGDGRKVATVAGAVVGGVVGNDIERKNSQGYTRYDVQIRMEGGNVQTMSFDHQPSWRRGDKVWLENGQLNRRN